MFEHTDAERIPLEPVDAVHLTTLVDNYSDMLLLDQGPARRVGVIASAGMPRVPEPLFEQGETIEGLHAEHGFSMLVTIHKGNDRSHIIFDTGMSPDGMAANMRRLGLDARDAEVVVLSHGHFDHTAAWTGSSVPSGGPTSRSWSIPCCGRGGASPSPASSPWRSPP